MGSGSQAQMPVLPERGDLRGLHGDGGLPWWSSPGTRGTTSGTRSTTWSWTTWRTSAWGEWESSGTQSNSEFTDQPMDSCQIARTTSRCGRQQLDLRIRWNYFVFNVFVRPSSGSRRVSNRWWVREGPHQTPLSSRCQRAQVLADRLLMVAVGNLLDKDIIFKVDKAYNRALVHNL